VAERKGESLKPRTKGFIAVLIIVLCANPTSTRAYIPYVQPQKKSPTVTFVKKLQVKATGYFGPLPQDYATKKAYREDVRINGKGIETNSGTRPKIGTIAADKRFYKLGTKVFIPEINLIGTVEDIGSAIKGPHRIDIFCGHGKEAKKTALTWGKGAKVTMMIIKET
jgi:3D (Asp-Asp-Asp) domain-containing protein